jgi:hypothetical protein
MQRYVTLVVTASDSLFFQTTFDDVVRRSCEADPQAGRAEYAELDEWMNGIVATSPISREQVELNDDVVYAHARRCQFAIQFSDYVFAIGVVSQMNCMCLATCSREIGEVATMPFIHSSSSAYSARPAWGSASHDRRTTSSNVV